MIAFKKEISHLKINPKMENAFFVATTKTMILPNSRKITRHAMNV